MYNTPPPRKKTLLLTDRELIKIGYDALRAGIALEDQIRAAAIAEAARMKKTKKKKTPSTPPPPRTPPTPSSAPSIPC